jgi:hypothetical protein
VDSTVCNEEVYRVRHDVREREKDEKERYLADQVERADFR